MITENTIYHSAQSSKGPLYCDDNLLFILVYTSKRNIQKVSHYYTSVEKKNCGFSQMYVFTTLFFLSK